MSNDIRDVNSQCSAATFKTQSQEHYCNRRKENIYTFLGDAYTGRGGFSGIADEAGHDCYLTADPDERLYQTRTAISVYVNNFKPFVNSKVDPIYSKKEPLTVVNIGDTEQEEHHYLDWVKNVNGLSQNKNDFNNNVLRAAVRDEVCYVVMDIGGDGLPVVYMQQAGTVDPDSIMLDEWSRLLQIGFIGNKDENTDIRYLWSDTELQIQESASGQGMETINGKRQWTTVEVRDVTIGRMPVYPVFANPRVDPSDYLPFPESYAIADMCANIYDAESANDWILHKQGFDTMVFKNADIEKVGRGTDWGIKITDPTGGNSDVYPYSPSADHPKNHLANLMYKQELLVKLANEGGVDATQSSTQAESGIAKAFTFQAKNESIQKMLSVARALDKWEYETYQLYYGEGNWEAVTLYETNFTPQPDISLEQLSDISEQFTLQGINTGRAETLKMIAMKIFDGNRDAIAAIRDEIESSQNNDAEVSE